MQGKIRTNAYPKSRLPIIVNIIVEEREEKIINSDAVVVEVLGLKPRDSMKGVTIRPPPIPRAPLNRPPINEI